MGEIESPGGVPEPSWYFGLLLAAKSLPFPLRAELVELSASNPVSLLRRKK